MTYVHSLNKKNCSFGVQIMYQTKKRTAGNFILHQYRTEISTTKY